MIWSGWSEFPGVPLRADLTPMGEGRPSGLHLGAIIQKMRAAAGEKTGAPEGWQDNVCITEGFLWETALEYVIGGMTMDEALDTAFKRYMWELRKNVVTQLSFVKDDIWMTPDGLDKTKGELESYKSTRKKMPATQEDFETKFWPWLVQEKSYCLAAGVDTVRWIVLFHAGDYSRGPGSGPRMMESTGVFTPQELVDNWRVVLKHAEQARREHAGILVSVPDTRDIQ